MNIRFTKEDIFLIVSAVLIIILAVFIFFNEIYTNSKDNQIVLKITEQAAQNNINQEQSVKDINQVATTTIIEWRCLSDDEEAGFYNRFDKFVFAQTEIPKEYPFEVIVRDKKNKVEKNRIIIDNIKENYHPIEIHKCGIYVIRQFNYNNKKRKQNPGYREEFWCYDYSGNGESLILLAEKPKEFISYYSTDFRVSTNEKYVVLEHGYHGKDDYSLIIKDLNTKEDIFILKLSDIIEKYPDVIGSFGMLYWKEDDKYFWADIFQGARALGYLKIDSNDWSWEVFETPDKHLAGFGPNFKTGWMPYVPSAVWTGIVEMDEEIRQEAKERGQTSILYLYNLFTKKQFKIYETAIDPIWNYGPPIWLSDTELEYKLPNGEKKVYEVK
ncbi:hypothetical protein KAU19_03235 [Candidatus Parcubacteria bacterium]|nr:hypothetical protein [Candidatus Parcubacteria bacterium]